MIQLEEFLAVSSPRGMLTWAESVEQGSVVGRAGDGDECPVSKWLELNGFRARVGIHVAYTGPAPRSVSLPNWLDEVVHFVDMVWAQREMWWKARHQLVLERELTSEEGRELNALRDILAKDLVSILKTMTGSEVVG